MAILKLYKDKLKHNYEFLDKMFAGYDISWGVVSKLLCGYKPYLKELINLGVKEIHDSRVSNLQAVKEIDPKVQTVYIKPPPKRSIPRIIRYADVSLNTEYETIRLLSKEAGKQGKTHKVLIMIEMGDLREGVLGEELLDFYEQVFQLPNIEIVGLGTNLNCMYGILPSRDKFIQLALYKQLIELKFNQKIPWVSGGTTVAIPLIFRNQLPRAVNHFRIGEALYYGLNLFTGKTIKGMEPVIFELFAEVIEVNNKPRVPFGDFAEDPSGDKYEVNPDDYGESSFRAILDVGLLDVNPKFLIPKNKNHVVVGGSSDMMVLDVGENKGNIKVGDQIAFRTKYMGALQLLGSSYIERIVE